LYNPKSGWIQNCNSTPFTASGESSPLKNTYPAYMAPEGQNGRALNAIRLLSKASNVTLDKIIGIGYNTYLTAFDYLLPPLFEAFRQLPPKASLKKDLTAPIRILQTWNKQASSSSVATTLAVEWAFKLALKLPPAKTPEAATNAVGNFQRMAQFPGREHLFALAETINELERLHGTWQIAWGEMNRYQRTANNLFDDSKESLPVGLAPGTWGCLPSYVSYRFNTKKRYGVSGNSFVAAVEFGKRLRAKTIITGGESFDPSSPHYTDQAKGFLEGTFKDINFYKEDVLKHAGRKYHPGE
jgi:acyl-homoserine-lactone acylase